MAAAAAFAAALVAAPSIRNDFAHDDHWVVAERPFLREPPSLVAVLREPYWPETFGGSLWRPAVLLSYAIDHQVSGDPQWFHTVNVLIAAASAAMLAVLATLLAGPVVGLVTGLLFAVHPVHVEATANVVGRAELMAALGYGLALVCAIVSTTDKRLLIGVVLGTVIAIGSKEHAVTLPLAVPLVLGMRGTKARTWWPAVTASAIPIVLYFALRPAITGQVLSAGGIAPGLGGLGLFGRSWAMLALSIEWWRLLLVPIHLSADYSPMELTVRAGLTAKHVLATGLWFSLAWFAWRSRRTVPGMVFGLVWVALTIIPVSNVLVPTEILIAERTLYLPSFGVVFAVATSITTLVVSRRATVAILWILLVAGTARSIVRAPVWRDDAALLAALGRDAPRSYRTLWLQGLEAFNSNRWGTAERLMRAAIDAAPGLPGPRDELARFYGAAGQWQPAVALLGESLAIDSTRPLPWELLPVALANAGDTVAAAHLAEAAAQRFPDHYQIRVNALAVLIAAERCDVARELAPQVFAQVPPEVPIDSTELVNRCD